MINLEKYKEKICMIGLNFSIDNNTKEFEKCNYRDCDNCYFNRGNCVKSRVDWLCSEACEWTEMDLTIIECLKKFGAYSIFRLQEGTLCWTRQDSNINYELPGFFLPFLENGRKIYIKDII